MNAGDAQSVPLRAGWIAAVFSGLAAVAYNSVGGR
jgi:hypothetical protein